MTLLTTAAAVLVQEAPAEPVVDPTTVTTGLLGFFVILGLALATWLLVRSMNRHLKRVDLPHAERGPARSRQAPPPATRPR